MRWRIEECFKFKKQQFELEELRVMLLQSISISNTGISSFYPPTVKSQQITLFEYFKIADSGGLTLKKWRNSKLLYKSILESKIKIISHIKGKFENLI